MFFSDFWGYWDVVSGGLKWCGFWWNGLFWFNLYLKLFCLVGFKDYVWNCESND